MSTQRQADPASQFIAQALACGCQGVLLPWQVTLTWPQQALNLRDQMWDAWLAHWRGVMPLDE